MATLLKHKAWAGRLHWWLGFCLKKLQLAFKLSRHLIPNSVSSWVISLAVRLLYEKWRLPSLPCSLSQSSEFLPPAAWLNLALPGPLDPVWTKCFGVPRTFCDVWEAFLSSLNCSKIWLWPVWLNEGTSGYSEITGGFCTPKWRSRQFKALLRLGASESVLSQLRITL